MSGLYRSSVSAAPLTTVGCGAGDEPSAEGEQAAEKKVEVLELADGFRVAVRRGLSATEEEQLRQKQQKPAVRIEKVVNAWGSAAGAGSDFFDCYRRTRNVEMRRLEKMDEEFRKKLEMEEFQLRRHQRMEETMKKNAAARERRRRRKMKQQEQQRARADNKKATPGSAAHGGVSAVDSAAGSCSIGATESREGGGVDHDACDTTAGEAQAAQKEAHRSRAENRITSRSPSASGGSRVSDDEARVGDVFRKKRRRQRKEESGDTQQQASEEEEAESGSSYESEGAESDAQKDASNKEQNAGERKRRRSEGKEQHLSNTAHRRRRSQSHERLGGGGGGGGQMGSSGGSTEGAVQVEPEEEEGKEDEDTYFPVMREGMITVHDSEW